MAFRFFDLDEATRSFMVDEVDRDTKQGTLYLSHRLTDRGRREWPELLRAAAKGGNEITLAEKLKGTGRLREVEYRQSHSRRGVGRTNQIRVPRTAAETLAEGEFNRFYMRGLCLCALDAGMSEVLVYRAKAVVNPRPESFHLVGTLWRADELLESLRGGFAEEEPTSRIPGGPNSGLSVRLPGANAVEKYRR